MKSTGIVRRIDDLGRVVIPREIRRTLHIKEGDPFEILVDDDGKVIFAKYQPLTYFEKETDTTAKLLSAYLGRTVAICTDVRVIAAAGPDSQQLRDKPIPESGKEAMESICGLVKYPFSFDDDASGHEWPVCASVPIIADGDTAGFILVFEEPQSAEADILSEAEANLLKTASGILAKNIGE